MKSFIFLTFTLLVSLTAFAFDNDPEFIVNDFLDYLVEIGEWESDDGKIGINVKEGRPLEGQRQLKVVLNGMHSQLFGKAVNLNYNFDRIENNFKATAFSKSYIKRATYRYKGRNTRAVKINIENSLKLVPRGRGFKLTINEGGVPLLTALQVAVALKRGGASSSQNKVASYTIRPKR